MNPIAGLFERRIRGFRVVEIVALGCLVLMVFWVYLTKAGAGAERGEIAQIEKQIRQEQGAVKLLRAEAAHLEQPSRIEALSESYLNLKPVEAKKEAQPDSLEEIARVGGAASR
jgi:cell division protein FtsL